MEREGIAGSARPAIVARGLTKRYRGIAVVDDLSFEIHWGRVTGFLGPNGAGKTTTLKMLVGLAAPTSGWSTLMGRRFSDLDDPAHSVGVLLDPNQFHPKRSGRNHLRVVAAAGGISDAGIDDALARVELEAAAGRPVGEYSLGMRQRLGLAAALLGDPKILILDEPANGLDPAGIKWLRDFLRDFVHRGRAAFVSSHLLREVSQVADEVVVINGGRLVVHTELDDLTHGAPSVVRARTPNVALLVERLERQGMSPHVSGPEEVTVPDANVHVVGEAAAAAGVVLYGLDAEEQNLEEIFFELTKEGAR